MSTKSLECYVIPSLPLPLLLPVDCIAAVVEEADIEELTQARAAWMKGYLTWNNQRLSVMSFGELISTASKVDSDTKQGVVVLNPIPDASRKAYSGLSFRGEVSKEVISSEGTFLELPEGVDQRYIEATIDVEGKQYLIPKLMAIGVAFTYF